MLEYRERNQPQPPETLGVDDTSRASRATRKEGYMELAARYGLQDMEIGGSEGKEQTVEQEYRAYIALAPPPTVIDILKFWEVGDSLMLF